MTKYRGSLQFAGFWGKGKPANCEIRELRGMFSMKTFEMGEKDFQSPPFRLSKSRKSVKIPSLGMPKKRN